MNTIIEKIKSWVNQRIDMWSKNREEMIKQECYTLADDSTCRIGELTDLLSFLDTLEKSEKPINPQPVKDNALFDSCLAKVNPETREEVRKNIDKMIEQPVDLDNKTIMEEIRKLGCYPSEFDVARRFYALGQQSKPEVSEGLEEEYEQIKQKVCSDCPSHKDDYCGYVKRQLQRKCNYLSDVMYGYELGRQSKPTTADGLEEEYKNYVEDDPVYSKLVNGIVGLSIARHFAKWGAEHLKK